MLHKIRAIVGEVAENFKTVCACTDEKLWKFKERLQFKQHNPTNRARFGFKVYEACQSTGRDRGYT